MNIHLPVLNAFIEDTCVIAVIAYLLARGRILEMMFSRNLSWTQGAALGALFGLAGISELIFPGQRSPYVVHTLIVSFAALTSGGTVGVAAAITIGAAATVLSPQPSSPALQIILLAEAALGVAVCRLWKHPGSLVRAGATCAAAQCCFVLFSHQFHAASSRALPIAAGLIAALANGLGGLLLQLIVNEAQMRTESVKNRLEAERSQALAAEAQLQSLRARVHPHFLFNALTSIAALCTMAPEKAERAVVQLSHLMRRALASSTNNTHPLRVELDHVKAYLDIEQHRLGDRLQVDWQIDDNALAVACPPFCVQMLVENAINHGIAPSVSAGRVRIRIHGRTSAVSVIVSDDGMGISPDMRGKVLQERQGQERGLLILNRQLELQFGNQSRLHLYSRDGQGTTICFQLPLRSGK